MSEYDEYLIFDIYNNYKIDVTPSKGGRDCLYDGRHYDKSGNLIEIGCDECDCYLICFEDRFTVSLY